MIYLIRNNHLKNKGHVLLLSDSKTLKKPIIK